MSRLLGSLLFLAVAPLSYAGWTNLGTEFLLAYGPNFLGIWRTNVDLIRIILAAPEESSVYVDIPVLSESTTYNVSANSYKYLDYNAVPTRFSGISGIERKYIRITSTKPIAIFGFNLKTNSIDGFLAYPVTQQSVSYVAMTYHEGGTSGSRSRTFLLVTTDTNDTQVFVSIRLQHGTSLFFQNTPYTSGSRINVTLQAGDVLGLVAEHDDLAGSQVCATNPVAAYSGADCTDVDYPNNCDHLAASLPPDTALGHTFITAPLFPTIRTGGDKFRMVAVVDNTSVTSIQGNPIVLNTGDNANFLRTSSDYEQFVSSQPVMFAQFSKGRTVDRSKVDPFMMNIPPVEQFNSEYVFATPSASTDYKHFINLVIESPHKNNILLNGLAITTTWHAISGSTFEATTILVSPGLYYMRNVDPSVSFGVYLYGYNTREPAAYGYPAGQRLVPLSTTTMLPPICNALITVETTQATQQTVHISPQTTKGNKNRTQTSISNEFVGEVPTSLFPMVAGTVAIILVVMMLCLICVLDAKTMLGSLRYGLGNVRQFFAGRCCRRERRQRRNARAVDIQNH